MLLPLNFLKTAPNTTVSIETFATKPNWRTTVPKPHSSFYKVLWGRWTAAVTHFSTYVWLYVNIPCIKANFTSDRKRWRDHKRHPFKFWGSTLVLSLCLTSYSRQWPVGHSSSFLLLTLFHLLLFILEPFHFRFYIWSTTIFLLSAAAIRWSAQELQRWLWTKDTTSMSYLSNNISMSKHWLAPLASTSFLQDLQDMSSTQLDFQIWWGHPHSWFRTFQQLC